MKKSFFKKYPYHIVGLLIISTFLWYGYKGGQEVEVPEEQEVKEEGGVTSARSSTYPLNLIEGEVIPNLKSQGYDPNPIWKVLYGTGYKDPKPEPKSKFPYNLHLPQEQQGTSASYPSPGPSPTAR